MHEILLLHTCTNIFCWHSNIFPAADHLRGGVVDVHHVLQHHVIVVDLDPLGDPGDGEELLVFVELYAGHDGAVVEHVRGVGQGGEGTDTVIPEHNFLNIAVHLRF